MTHWNERRKKQSVPPDYSLIEYISLLLHIMHGGGELIIHLFHSSIVHQIYAVTKLLVGN